MRLDLILWYGALVRLSRPALSTCSTVLALAATLGVLGCGRSGPAAVGHSGSGPRFVVVAAENFWGSIATQLAGGRASVRSIIVDPSTDPHSYQPSAGDARVMTSANVAIVNGVGYDDWAEQLLQGSPSAGRAVLNVGELLALPQGANPHRWYYPADVTKVIDAIVADFDRIDPADSAYFAARSRAFSTVALAGYDRIRATIRARYRGTPVGYSESIFQGLGEDLGLRLLTPRSFAKAVAEGTDVTAGDKRTVDSQAEHRRIAVWVFNSQNVTPDVQRVNQIVRARGIPIVSVTETLSPATASFEQWQTHQLQELQRALHRATGH
jgi:zinc/manganese transport system substrate-binding protein